MDESTRAIQGTFSNRGDAMPRVLALVDRLEEECGVPAETLTDLRIALDEVVTNIIKYAYRDEGRHEITIRCVVRGGFLETTVEDDGIAFDPLLAPAPDISAPVATRAVGGLGLHFLRNLMSDLSYQRLEGRNRLTLTQKLPEKK